MAHDGVVDPSARIDYSSEHIPDVLTSGTPLEAVSTWYLEASEDDRVVEPGAMVVATVDELGMPDARTVLLKHLDARGLVFFTATTSAKGRELAARPVASVVLLWHAMHRQVRARGEVERVSEEDAVAYFTSRPRGSQVAAWASMQSEPLASRADLEAAVADVERRFEGHEVLPLPDFWGGYRVRPRAVELWAGQRSRLHDRWLWTAADDQPALLDDPTRWTGTRLQP